MFQWEAEIRPGDIRDITFPARRLAVQTFRGRRVASFQVPRAGEKPIKPNIQKWGKAIKLQNGIHHSTSLLQARVSVLNLLLI